MDRDTTLYTKKLICRNFLFAKPQNRKKNRKFQKRRTESRKEKKREDIIRRGGEWIGSSVRVARLAGAPVCRYSRFSPLAAYCICAQCILHNVYSAYYIVPGLHNLRLVLISKFSQNFIPKTRTLCFSRHLRQKCRKSRFLEQKRCF